MLILDSGGLYALLDRDDQDHATTVAAVAHETGPFVLPTLVLAEVGFLISRRGGSAAELRFVAEVAAGRYELDHPTQGDLDRAVELLGDYGDLDLGITDATVMACAERRGCRRILSLDRRDFLAVRPRGFAAFELLP